MTTDEHTTALVTTAPAFVMLAAPVAQVVAQWREYQELTLALLEASDFQQIGGKSFKKKSAWRKYARAFNITDRLIKEEIVRDADGYPIYARMLVEASHPSGRSAQADHECHVSEKCCPTKDGMPCPKASWSRHTCCQPGCTGRIHFSHPGDIPATALTRAKNRAISDLIGAGEVSAEEVEGSQASGDFIEGDYTVQEGDAVAREPDGFSGTVCKFCNSGCYDNRADKRNNPARYGPSSPDFKCKKCSSLAWIQDGGELRWVKK